MFYPVVITCPTCRSVLQFQAISFSKRGVVRFEMSCCGRELVFDLTWEDAMRCCVNSGEFVVELTKTKQ